MSRKTKSTLARTVAWLKKLSHEVSMKVITDIIKDQFFALMRSWVGAAILVGAIAFLVSTYSWLRHPVTLPVFEIILGILIILAFVLGLISVTQKAQSKKRTSIPKKMYGLNWVIKSNKELTGPFCPICNNEVCSAKEDLDEQMAKATEVIFGKKREYKYSCIGCGYIVVLPYDPLSLWTIVSKQLIKPSRTNA